jgi:mercury(II) reductase
MIEKLEVLPKDEHNAELVSNVHPSDWINPEPAERYNLVVIGAGTAGLVTAAGAAGLGAKVALVERHSLGGDCLNVGCVPSKAIIRSARAAFDITDAGRFGIGANGDSNIDFATVMERMRKLRAQISNHDSAARFRDLGVDVFLGEARFSGPDTVEVDGKKLRFKKAVIATGARPINPPAEGLAEAGFLTNETVFSLTERPDRLVVIGGGPIGCELAQAFRRLGSEVDIVGRAQQFLPREDPEAAAILEAAFKNEGINVLLGTDLKRVTTDGAKKLVHVEKDGAEKVLEADQILVGAGRAPNVEGLNLEGVGVEYNKRGVVVDDNLRTTNPRIFAAGDICLNFKFTHTADAAARIVIQNALFWGRKKLSALTVPWCTYTDPEIAHVGMYEADAEKQGIEVDTYMREFKEVDRAIVEGETAGLVKVHVKKGTDKIVGATIVARHAGEMISEITLAIVGGVGLGTIAGVIHPYPTQAEAIKQVGDAYNRTRLTPFVKNLFTRLMTWQR